MPSLALCALAQLCIACAATGQNVPAQSSAQIQEMNQQARATRIAEVLVQAEDAYASKNNERLGELVATLKASGLRALGGREADALTLWSRASGSETPPFRGRLLGPAYVRGNLAPGEVWRSAQTFKSGEASTLSVSHLGEGPVNMTVSDAKARPVCKLSRSATPPCRFTPIFTQRFDIVLTNEGDDNAVYFLVFD